MYDEQKRQIVSLCREGVRKGMFAGTSGNLSLFVRADAVMLITPTSVPYDVLRAEQVTAMRLDGAVLEGDKPSSEWRLHAALYESFDDVCAVFHTHSPYATAFAVNHMSIPDTLIEMNHFLGGDVRCAQYATPGTKEVGLNAACALRGRGGCTLANHGVVAVGGDLAQACLRAEYIEDAARINAIALSIGKPVSIEKL